MQKAARDAYRLWCSDPHHPSLRFKPLAGHENRFSVRIGLHHRALASIEGSTVKWVWIGTHAEYDRLVGR